MSLKELSVEVGENWLDRNPIIIPGNNVLNILWQDVFYSILTKSWYAIKAMVIYTVILLRYYLRIEYSPPLQDDTIGTIDLKWLRSFALFIRCNRGIFPMGLIFAPPFAFNNDACRIPLRLRVTTNYCEPLCTSPSVEYRFDVLQLIKTTEVVTKNSSHTFGHLIFIVWGFDIFVRDSLHMPIAIQNLLLYRRLHNLFENRTCEGIIFKGEGSRIGWDGEGGGSRSLWRRWPESAKRHADSSQIENRKLRYIIEWRRGCE